MLTNLSNAFVIECFFLFQFYNPFEVYFQSADVKRQGWIVQEKFLLFCNLNHTSLKTQKHKSSYLNSKYYSFQAYFAWICCFLLKPQCQLFLFMVNTFFLLQTIYKFENVFLF